MNKINLLGINLEELTKIMHIIGEKDFHSKQIFEWLHKKNIIDVESFTNLNKNLKEKIKNIFNIKLPKIIKEEISIDNTIKWLLEMDKNECIETIAMPNKKGNFTLCLSSQIGCISNCSFCFTAKQGFLRNLLTSEIIGQIYKAKERLNKIFNNKYKVTNIVMMGMGEPLLNYNNLSNALKIIKSKYGYNISQNNITISTCGIIPGIKKIQEHNVRLAISLHATNNKLRTQLMPINKKYNIESLLETCKDYKSKNPITFEYIVIKNINDSNKNSSELIELLKNIKCKICLIPFNKFNGTIYDEPDLTTLEQFKKTLNNAGIVTTIRRSMGKDISAACGQLSGKFNDKTNRNKKFNIKNI